MTYQLRISVSFSLACFGISNPTTPIVCGIKICKYPLHPLLSKRNLHIWRLSPMFSVPCFSRNSSCMSNKFFVHILGCHSKWEQNHIPSRNEWVISPYPHYPMHFHHYMSLPYDLWPYSFPNFLGVTAPFKNRLMGGAGLAIIKAITRNYT